MVESEPLIHWPEPFVQYAGFAASFLASGAIGFRYAVLGRRRGAPAGTVDAVEWSVLERAARGAAALGFLGALTGVILFTTGLPALAARRHVTVEGLLTGSLPEALRAVLVLAALAGFALALGRRAPGWPLAAIAVIAGALRQAFFAQWARLVNPIHELAGGMWIGTLFVLVVAGLSAVLRSGLSSERRGVLAAGMVNAFSPFALGSAAVLAIFGVITAWRQLKVLAALWTTPFGVALIVKLCVVLVVLGLGAWNWRRQKPRMGTEAGAIALRRSARAELAAAAVVLAITAILVSLPDPKPPVP
jgi:putative copper export protein